MTFPPTQRSLSAKVYVLGHFFPSDTLVIGRIDTLSVIGRDARVVRQLGVICFGLGYCVSCTDPRISCDCDTCIA